nr:hypothetical protein GCM10025732_05990 [Glycomyces mayteni]
MHLRTPGRRARRLSLAGAVTLTAAAAATAIAFNAAGTGPTAMAAAVAIDPLAPALNFNTFVEDRTTLVSTESEGPMATGGDLVIKGSYNVDIHGEATFTAPGTRGRPRSSSAARSTTRRTRRPRSCGSRATGT